MTVTMSDTDLQQVIDDLREELAEAYVEQGKLCDDVDAARDDEKALAGELDDLNTRARLAGHYNIDEAMTWVEDSSDPTEIVARWHDEAHSGSRRFCDEEPCTSLIKGGWSLT